MTLFHLDNVLDDLIEFGSADHLIELSIRGKIRSYFHKNPFAEGWRRPLIAEYRHTDDYKRITDSLIGPGFWKKNKEDLPLGLSISPSRLNKKAFNRMMGQEQLGRAGRDRLRKSGAIVIPHPSALESSSLGKYETPENVARQTLHHELTLSLIHI